MARYHLTRISENKKTGPIPVSVTSADTCPHSCPLRAKVCYAKKWPMRLHWERVSSGLRGVTLRQFTRLLSALPAGTLFRHNAAGDLPGKNERVDSRALSVILRASRHLTAWTYTHKRDWKALRRANAAGSMVVNLSANSLAEADTLAATGTGPVTAVIPKESRPGLRTPGGRLVAICPAQLSAATTCATCGAGSPLCARRERAYIVGFRQH